MNDDLKLIQAQLAVVYYRILRLEKKVSGGSTSISEKQALEELQKEASKICGKL